MTPSAEILAVDDHPLNLKLLNVVLTRAGYAVRTAEDSVSTFAALESWLPQLILMDIQLPGASGLEIIRILKADARTAAIPIVAVTAYAMKGDAEKAIAAGADGYLTKPLDTRELTLLVASFVSGDNSKPPVESG